VKGERGAGEVLRERRPDKSVCSNVNEPVRLHSRTRAGSHTSKSPTSVWHFLDCAHMPGSSVESEREFTQRETSCQASSWVAV